MHDDLKCLQESEPQAESVVCVVDASQEYDWQNDETLCKSEKQLKAILKVIEQKQFKPLGIPDRGKKAIQKICEADYHTLFDCLTSFDNAWGLAKKGETPLVRMANHASYAKRGNQ
jgi:hypothetical protein